MPNRLAMLLQVSPSCTVYAVCASSVGASAVAVGGGGAVGMAVAMAGGIAVAVGRATVALAAGGINTI